jgi:hypothetical protein
MHMTTLTTIALLLALSGCVSEPLIETYEIFPRSAVLINSGGDTAQVFVNMYIGSNLCHQYAGYRSELERSTQSVRFFATRPTPAANATCLMELAHMQDTVSVVRFGGANSLKFKLESGGDTVISLTD